MKEKDAAQKIRKPIAIKFTQFVMVFLIICFATVMNTGAATLTFNYTANAHYSELYESQTGDRDTSKGFNWYETLLGKTAINQFDPTLGTLNSVSIGLDVDWESISYVAADYRQNALGVRAGGLMYVNDPNIYPYINGTQYAPLRSWDVQDSNPITDQFRETSINPETAIFGQSHQIMWMLGSDEDNDIMNGVSIITGEALASFIGNNTWDFAVDWGNMEDPVYHVNNDIIYTRTQTANGTYTRHEYIETVGIYLNVSADVSIIYDYSEPAAPLDPPSSPTPEPGTITLLGLGLLGLAGITRRKNQ